jgi:hypothetical protein
VRFCYANKQSDHLAVFQQIFRVSTHHAQSFFCLPPKHAPKQTKGAPMQTRTEIRFNTHAAQWNIIEHWAADESYKLQNSSATERLYQKGSGFLVAPMMLHIRQDGGQTVMQAWISANMFVRAFALFLLPAEMGIESGGFKAMLPRKIARTAVNKLMANLQLPAIP